MERMEKVLQHFEKEAQEFDEIIVKLIPDYKFMLDILVDFIPYNKEDKFSVIDLGCGTGTLAKAIKDKFPEADITCLDVSERMLEIAKNKVGENTKIIQKDFYNFNFSYKYDLIVSSLALHHLESKNDKLDFYQKIYSALNEKGIFINIDVMLGSDAELQQIYLENWKKFMKSNMSAQEVEEKWLPNYHSEDRPSSLFEHFKLLEESKFKIIDCVYKNYNYGVYLAKKI